VEKEKRVSDSRMVAERVGKRMVMKIDLSPGTHQENEECIAERKKSENPMEEAGPHGTNNVS
jgi:hypothetical protein